MTTQEFARNLNDSYTSVAFLYSDVYKAYGTLNINIEGIPFTRIGLHQVNQILKRGRQLDAYEAFMTKYDVMGPKLFGGVLGFVNGVEQFRWNLKMFQRFNVLRGKASVEAYLDVCMKRVSERMVFDIETASLTPYQQKIIDYAKHYGMSPNKLRQAEDRIHRKGVPLVRYGGRLVGITGTHFKQFQSLINEFDINIMTPKTLAASLKELFDIDVSYDRHIIKTAVAALTQAAGRVWTTADKRRIPYGKLTNSHLINILNYVAPRKIPELEAIADKRGLSKWPKHDIILEGYVKGQKIKRVYVGPHAYELSLKDNG